MTDDPRRPGPDDPLAFAIGCANALLIMAVLAIAGFLVAYLITR